MNFTSLRLRAALARPWIAIYSTVVFVAQAWLLTASQPTFAATLLQDNFNDNSLNGTLWTTNTAASGSSVLEQNQRIEITERGLLITAQEYDPLVTGALTITGRWHFNSSNAHGDILDVLTRSDPTDLSIVGYPQNGITFQYNDSGGGLNINIQKVTPSGFSLLGFAPINFAPGEVFDFTITDDGTNLTFAVVEVGGGGKTASTSGTDSTDFASDYVTFTNSRFGPPYVAYLDNVVIQNVPEPGTMLLALAGALVLPLFARRGRCQRAATYSRLRGE